MLRQIYLHRRLFSRILIPLIIALSTCFFVVESRAAECLEFRKNTDANVIHYNRYYDIETCIYDVLVSPDEYKQLLLDAAVGQSVGDDMEQGFQSLEVLLYTVTLLFALIKGFQTGNKRD